MTKARRDFITDLAGPGTLGLFVGAAVPATAQPTWPAKPLLMVIAYAAGGAIDGLVRSALARAAGPSRLRSRHALLKGSTRQLRPTKTRR